jgi:regulatory protein
MLQKCLDYAINYLYRVPKTERDLKVQLMKKGFSESDIENTLIELKRLKYIDDENYVRMYIESELINK